MSRMLYRQNGFTLIELIVALTIMATLSSLGIASYVTYSRSQALQNATQDVVTILQSAKASTVSQVKPNTCTSALETLDGYQVIITPLTNTYTLGPVCNGELKNVERKDMVLPTNIEFTDLNTPLSITFHTVNGHVSFNQEQSDIILREIQSGAKKKIHIFSDGRINVSNVVE